MKRYRTVCWLLLVALVVTLLPVGAWPALAQGSLPDFVPDDAAFGLPDVRGRALNNLDAWWVIENPDAAAPTTRVVFDTVALRAGDVVTIMDAEGRVYQQFGPLVCPQSDGPCPAASVAVPGHVLLLHLQTGSGHGLRDAFKAAAVATGIGIFTGPLPPPGYRVLQVVREQEGMPIERAATPQRFNWYTTAYLYVPENVPTGQPVDVVVDVLPLGPHEAADSWTLNADVLSVDDTGSVVFAYDSRAATLPLLAEWEWIYVDPATGERRAETITGPGGEQNNFLARRDGGMLSIVYQALKDGAGARDLLDVMFEPAAAALNDLFVLGLLQGDSESPGTFTLAQADYALLEMLIPPVPHLERVRFTLPILFERPTPLPLQVYVKVKSLRPRAFPLGLPAYPWVAKFSAPLFAGVEMPPTLPGRIVFVSDRDGNDEIYVMNADGSDVRRLTDDPAEDQGPVWSPDGTRIAFHSHRSGNWDIYVMNADGSNVTQLTRTPGTDSNPAWSPDGTKLVFHANRDGRWHIYRMNAADGGDVVQLTTGESSHDSPVWSPDGTRIAFGSDRAGAWDVYMMDADGGNVTRLTDDPATETKAAWSPDGTRIAFHTPRDGDWNIYTVDVDTGEQLRLTDDLGDDARPGWSPDGRYLLFDSNRSGNSNYEIYIMDADGGNIQRLTNNPAYDREADWWMPPVTDAGPRGRIAFEAKPGEVWNIYTVNPDGSGLTQLTGNDTDDRFPAWSPDGTQIAFVSRRGGNPDIYVMDADGGNVVQLTDGDGAQGYPAWSPDGTQIAYSSSRDGNFAIYVMDADGGNATPLGAGQGLMPVWSPDGAQIAFVSDRSGDMEIYVMDMAEVGRVRRLTRNRGLDAMPAWSPDGTQIAFVSDRDDPDGDIYVMDSNGRNVTRLTNRAGGDGAPVWSPDGTQIAFLAEDEATGIEDIHIMDLTSGSVTRVTRMDAEKFLLSWGRAPGQPTASRVGRIAFVSDRGPNFDIYAMDVDGNNLTQLTANAGIDSWPVWSPDGTRIAFHSFVDDTSGEIYLMDADGGNLTRLTDSPGADMYPAWSPDGTRIVFQSSRNGGLYDLYVMDADGGNVVQLTDDEARDGYPHWSPDGTQILFQSTRTGMAQFYLLDVASGDVTQLTDDDLAKESPQWSPDGTRITFHAFPAAGVAAEIYLLDVASGRITRVTDNDVIDHYAAWTADGRILFVSQRDGNAEAYIMHADGTGQTNLTNDPASDWYPVWQPGSGAGVDVGP